MQFRNPSPTTVHYSDGETSPGAFVEVTLKRRLPNKRDQVVWRFSLAPGQSLLDPAPVAILFGGSLGSLVIHSDGEVGVY